MESLITLVFSAVNAQQQYVEFIYSNPDFASCLDELSFLATCGWRFVTIKCLYGRGPFFNLPVEAFDGKPFGDALGQLQSEWEKLLKADQ